MSVPTVPSAIGHLLQRPPSPPPLLQPRSVSIICGTTMGVQVTFLVVSR